MSTSFWSYIISANVIRLDRAGAHSYFVAGNRNYPQDLGFLTRCFHKVCHRVTYYVWSKDDACSWEGLPCKSVNPCLKVIQKLSLPNGSCASRILTRIQTLRRCRKANADCGSLD